VTRRYTPLVATRLADTTAEQVRRSHAQAIGEWQASAAAGLRVITGITVNSNQVVTVAHGLGRAPLWVGVSAVRWDKTVTAALAVGTVIDYGSNDDPFSPAGGNPVDRTKVVKLGALGFTTGASVVAITFDLLVL